MFYITPLERQLALNFIGRLLEENILEQEENEKVKKIENILTQSLPIKEKIEDELGRRGERIKYMSLRFEEVIGKFSELNVSLDATLNLEIGKKEEIEPYSLIEVPLENPGLSKLKKYLKEQEFYVQLFKHFSRDYLESFELAIFLDTFFSEFIYETLENLYKNSLPYFSDKFLSFQRKFRTRYIQFSDFIFSNPQVYNPLVKILSRRIEEVRLGEERFYIIKNEVFGEKAKILKEKLFSSESLKNVGLKFEEELEICRECKRPIKKCRCRPSQKNPCRYSNVLLVYEDFKPPIEQDMILEMAMYMKLREKLSYRNANVVIAHNIHRPSSPPESDLDIICLCMKAKDILREIVAIECKRSLQQKDIDDFKEKIAEFSFPALKVESAIVCIEENECKDKDKVYLVSELDRLVEDIISKN